ncbi:MAG: alpha-D-glucose phosphate-specific phosphoglucomutase, partial [Nevskia sp.]|nr:alpha-D-glucose phosphate-specific phosphoglucomutase [Nevskia sp.]
LIRLHHAAGGLLFTASHNPAGPDGDFGIKFNIAGGGQASETLTGKIYEQSTQLTRYRIVEGTSLDLDRRGAQKIADTDVDVVDSVEDYARLQQSLFDFDRIREWFKKGGRLRFDAMHAVTGPYAKRIFIEQLGAPETSVMNGCPLEDFGDGHPDPNLIYAKHLYDLAMSADGPDLIAASDGDGDRNMILGRGLFISPGDSLAMLAAHLDKLPGYKGRLKGLARSMPTCRAVDQVARALGVECHETPTGWKFFCNLLDAGRLTLCGEESFGTSSSHTREKDGLWAVLAWLNILAVTGMSVQQIAQAHWQRFGRHYYARHDYDDLPVATANAVMAQLKTASPNLIGQHHGAWTISQADEFSYTDPIDGSVATAQGLRIVFGEAARIILRLSGTGTQGATLRLYLERYETGVDALAWQNNEALAPLAIIADKLIRIAEQTGRKTPSVIT